MIILIDEENKVIGTEGCNCVLKIVRVDKNGIRTFVETNELFN